MTLQEWQNEGRLKLHRSSRTEISRLVAVFDRDIADSQSTSISIDRRFATAYNAALTVSTAALAAAGYRTTGEGHHYLTIQSLAFTLTLDSQIVERFNRLRRKRNMTDYEMIGAVSEIEAQEMLELARDLRAKLDAWLAACHPDLMP